MVLWQLKRQKKAQRSVVWVVAILAAMALGDARAFDPAAGDLQRQSADHIRVLSYNTERKFIANAPSDDEFARVITAINPDVIAFQEIAISGTPAAVEAAIQTRLESYFPGDTWAVHAGISDGFIRNALASRYPLSLQITDTTPASEVRGVTAALIDLPDGVFGTTDFYVMDVHFKSFGTQTDHMRRQIHADAIVNWIRDARISGCLACPLGDQIDLPDGTPMLVVGDMNLGFQDGGDYAPYHPTKTLRTGDIYDEATYGPDAPPDWDATNSGDAAPYDHNTADSHTQPGDTTDPTSRLDRFIYTDAVLHAANRFVLSTLTMLPSALTAAGLQANDTVRDANGAPDHLPVVVDFALGPDPAPPGRLIVNEFSYDDAGADGLTFLEFKNVGGQNLNLQAPVDYQLITTFNNVPTVPPASPNARETLDLQGVIPPGGLFVVYDTSLDSADVAASVTARLPVLQWQDFADFPGTFSLYNGPDAGFASVTTEPWIRSDGTDLTTDTLVEAYLYEDTTPAASNFLRAAGGNQLLIEFTPTQSSGAEVISDTNSYSRRAGDETGNDFAFWRIPDRMTPGLENASTFNTSPTLLVNAGITVGRGETALITDTQLFATDLEQGPAQLVFTVETFPVHGTLTRDSVALSPSGTRTFTQSDLTTGLVAYAHDGIGADPDSFTFTLFDGDTGSVNETLFQITVVPPSGTEAWFLF
jgi:endonuclease/exonuclease/phosphatase family metal-dependent hydrolase